MHKYNQIFGVVISNVVFDGMSYKGEHLQFENIFKGFHQLALFKSIPGMGTKIRIILIVITHRFTKFDSAKHPSSYAGTTPGIC